jgi:alpha-mannosidase
LGTQTFTYAVVPFEGDCLDAGVKDLSQRYRTRPVSVQGVADSSIGGGLSLFEHSSEHTCVSAIKRHEERDTLVIRLFNLCNGDTSDTLSFGLDISAAWRVDLLEERITPLQPLNARKLDVQVGPHEILTLEVEFAKGTNDR